MNDIMTGAIMHKQSTQSRRRTVITGCIFHINIEYDEPMMYPTISDSTQPAWVKMNNVKKSKQEKRK